MGRMVLVEVTGSGNLMDLPVDTSSMDRSSGAIAKWLGNYARGAW